MANLFNYGVEWLEPSTWDFDIDIYVHWLEDSYYCLGREWKEGQECESKEVLCVFVAPSLDVTNATMQFIFDDEEPDVLIEVTDQERCGCLGYLFTECQSL